MFIITVTQGDSGNLESAIEILRERLFDTIELAEHELGIGVEIRRAEIL